MRIAAIETHFGEEPPFTGCNGSGTVFFTGCSLRCSYCQNYQISRLGMGRSFSVSRAAARISQLHRLDGIHNVNLVTPDHFIPHAIALVSELRNTGVQLPVIFNVSGYQRVASLRLVEPYVDIYLPDFKYGDAKLGAALSRAEDYPSLALEAIQEMLRQKGFLDRWKPWRGSSSDLPMGVAAKGVMVRHLVLPGQLKNSLDALTMLFLEFGADLPLSLMSQYAPVGNPLPEGLDRAVLPAEFKRVLHHALELGFRRILYQPLTKTSAEHCESPFLPDFTKKTPFLGNIEVSVRAKQGRSSRGTWKDSDFGGKNSAKKLLPKVLLPHESDQRLRTDK